MASASSFRAAASGLSAAIFVCHHVGRYGNESVVVAARYRTLADPQRCLPQRASRDEVTAPVR